MGVRDGVFAKVEGLPDLRRELMAIPAKLRVRALRNALAAGARVVRDEAKRSAPVLSTENAMRAPYRKPRTVQKAISVRTSKQARRRGDVGVFVNVRPAKNSDRGAKSQNDPFYWRWLEFGWNPAGQRTGGRRGPAGIRERRKLNKAGSAKIRSGWGFLQKGAEKLGAALEVFKAKLGPAIEKLNRPKAPAP